MRVLLECGSRFSGLVRAERTGLRIPSTPDLGPTHPLVQCVMGKGSVKLATHLPLVPRVRMSGAMPLLSPYVFRTWIWTGTSSTFTFPNMDKLTVKPLVRS